jgi:glycosyltransferase involved in cell wall biosynthesis
MQQPEISIVIPVYNAEKFLEQCLNSILQQTYKNWECIIVNDGSTDNSLSIIQKFASQDDRFSYITISNTGTAYKPRRLAISYAKSNWMLHVDADDFIDYDTVEKLFNRANETKADIVYLRMYLFNDSDPDKCLSTIPAEDFDMKQVLSGKDAVMLTIGNWTIGGKGLIKRHLYNQLSSQNFNTAENTWNRDEYETREVLMHANTIAFANTIYYYRKYSESITAKFHIKWFDKLITDQMLEELIKKHFGNNSTQHKQMQQQRMGGIIGGLYTLYKFGNSLSSTDKKKAGSMIKSHYIDIEKKELYKNAKMKRILVTKNYHLFKASVYIYVLLKQIWNVLKHKNEQ